MKTKKLANKPYSFNWKTWTIWSSLFVAVFVGLLVVANFFDWEISEAVAKPFLNDGQYFSSSIFASIVEVLGVSFISVMLLISLSVCFVNTYRLKNKIKNGWIITIRVIIFILCVISLLAGLFPCFENLDLIINNTLSLSNDHFAIIVSCAIIGAVLFSLLSIYYFVKKSENKYQMLRWAIMTIVTVCVVLLVVFMMKELIFRPRYRSIYFNQSLWLTNDAHYYFVPLFQLNVYEPTLGTNWIDGGDFNKSFPSGHTSGAASIYCLMALPLVFKKYNNAKWKAIWWLIPILLVGLVAIGRIMGGAHYMSDVLVGGSIGFVIYMVMQYIFIQSNLLKSLDKDLIIN